MLAMCLNGDGESQNSPKMTSPKDKYRHKDRDLGLLFFHHCEGHLTEAA